MVIRKFVKPPILLLLDYCMLESDDMIGNRYVLQLLSEEKKNRKQDFNKIINNIKVKIFLVIRNYNI